MKRALLLILLVLTSYLGYRLVHWILPPPTKPYVIGMDPTWDPVALYGRDGEMTAFASDLLFAIAKDQDIKIQVAKVRPKCLFEMLDDARIEGALTPLTQESPYRGEYQFSDPFYRYGAILIAPKASEIHSVLQLEKKRVGVKRSSPILYRLAMDPLVIIIPYDSPLAALRNLVKGDLDAVVMDQLFHFLNYKGIYNGRLKVATLPLTQEGLRLATLKDDAGKELIEKFNAGLKNLQENGTYHELLEKWDLYDPEVL